MVCNGYELASGDRIHRREIAGADFKALGYDTEEMEIASGTCWMRSITARRAWGMAPASTGW